MEKDAQQEAESKAVQKYIDDKRKEGFSKERARLAASRKFSLSNLALDDLGKVASYAHGMNKKVGIMEDYSEHIAKCHEKLDKMASKKDPYIDSGTHEAIKQSIAHNINKHGPNKKALDATIDMVDKRLRKSGQWVNLPRAKSALSQSFGTILKEEELQEMRGPRSFVTRIMSITNRKRAGMVDLQRHEREKAEREKMLKAIEDEKAETRDMPKRTAAQAHALRKQMDVKDALKSEGYVAPYHIDVDGKKYTMTGKKGKHIESGEDSHEYAHKTATTDSRAWRTKSGKVVREGVELDESRYPTNEHSDAMSMDAKNAYKHFGDILKSKGFEKKATRKQSAQEEHVWSHPKHGEISINGWHGTGSGNRDYGGVKQVQGLYHHQHNTGYGNDEKASFMSRHEDGTENEKGHITEKGVHAHREHISKITSYLHNIGNVKEELDLTEGNIPKVHGFKNFKRAAEDWASHHTHHGKPEYETHTHKLHSGGVLHQTTSIGETHSGNRYIIGVFNHSNGPGSEEGYGTHHSITQGIEESFETLESLDEKYIGFSKLAAKVGPRVAAIIGRKKYGAKGMHDSKSEHKKEDAAMHKEDVSHPPANAHVVKHQGEVIGHVWTPENGGGKGDHTWYAKNVKGGHYAGYTSKEWAINHVMKFHQKSLKEETVVEEKTYKVGDQLGESFDTLEEGRPSQRHPLEGHPYHSKSDDSLHYIIKDAGEAAKAMKSHNPAAESKYLDQQNDAATVLGFRKRSGTPDWYKKKYKPAENIKEEHLTEADKKDVISMDIPLLIRVLEYVREDIKSDENLHRVVERLIDIRDRGTLTMDDYNFIANLKEDYADELNEKWEVKQQVSGALRPKFDILHHGLKVGHVWQGISNKWYGTHIAKDKSVMGKNTKEDAIKGIRKIHGGNQLEEETLTELVQLVGIAKNKDGRRVKIWQKSESGHNYEVEYDSGVKNRFSMSLDKVIDKIGEKGYQMNEEVLNEDGESLAGVTYVTVDPETKVVHDQGGLSQILSIVKKDKRLVMGFTFKKGLVGKKYVVNEGLDPADNTKSDKPEEKPPVSDAAKKVKDIYNKKKSDSKTKKKDDDGDDDDSREPSGEKEKVSFDPKMDPIISTVE